MKLTIDTNTGVAKCGSKSFEELNDVKRQEVEKALRHFLLNNFMMCDYEEDSMWMSYRYCIGRKTIASHMHANDIWVNCRGRMTSERSLFTAYDINESIENHMRFSRYFDIRFPMISECRIRKTALDMFFQFLIDYNVKSVNDLLEFKSIEFEYTNDEKGFKIFVSKWDEYIRNKVRNILKSTIKEEELTDEFVDEYWRKWKKCDVKDSNPLITLSLDKLNKELPNDDYFSMSDFEDLMVWNDLVHCFDHEHHHKSVLKDGTECEWFWSWRHNVEKRDDGFYYNSFGYTPIRVPLDKWNGSVTTWIPDESIEKDLY